MRNGCNRDWCTMKITVSFTLNSEKDADILDWLDGLASGEKSSQIRDAVRSYIRSWAGEDITLRDIMREIQDLKRHGVVVQSGVVEESDGCDEPPDIVNTLKNLGI